MLKLETIYERIRTAMMRKFRGWKRCSTAPDIAGSVTDYDLPPSDYSQYSQYCDPARNQQVVDPIYDLPPSES